MKCPVCNRPVKDILTHLRKSKRCGKRHQEFLRVSMSAQGQPETISMQQKGKADVS